MRRGELAAAGCAACARFDPSESNRWDMMSPLLLPLTPRFITLTLAVPATVVLRRGPGVRPALDRAGDLLRRRALPDHRRHRSTSSRHPTRSCATIRSGALALHLRGDPAGDAAVLLRGRQGRHAVQPRPPRRRLPARQDGARRAAVRHPLRRLRDGYEWMPHSIAPRPVAKEPFRIMIGDPDCTQPYSASVFNISAMSFGVAQRQRHPRAERRRQARRLRARHRRRRLQPLSPRERRRHHLGDRLGLFRRAQSRRHLLAREVRRRRRQPAGQDGRAEAQPGRQAGPWRRAAGAQGQRARSR